MTNENSIEILLRISPSNVGILNLADLNSIIEVQSSIPISNITLVRNPNGTATVTVKYKGNIERQSITIIIDPASSGSLFFSKTIAASSTIVVIPEDNKDAYYYPNSVYQLQNITSKFATFVGFAALGVFVLGLISGKMIGVEMMAVVQISFFSLITLS
jgi:hypothetical protein